MSIRTTRNRTLALAGILQSLHLVQQTAYGKPCDADAMQTSLRSVLSLDAASVDAVYDGIAGLRTGLDMVRSQLLGERGRPDPELGRYLVVLLHLERKLGGRPRLLKQLSTRIAQVQRQVDHFGVTHANVLAGLADTYSDTVSTLNPRIMINGDPARLQDPAVANQIRALLLAAMRSAVLWRQCGGSRLGLLFGRRKLSDTAQSLLHEGHVLH
jgi:high frequency lysogenization protein